MMRIFLGLGSNLGDREWHLTRAKELLDELGVGIVAESDIEETEPLDGVDQPDYLNQVVEVYSELAPEDLLRVCRTVEVELGRPELRAKGESRTMDIDILLYGDMVVDTELLSIPHPGIVDREFVQRGLVQLAPELVHDIIPL